MSLIKGISITLIEKVQTETDPYKQPIFEESETTIEDVLVDEPSTDDIQNALTMYGKRISYVLAIPKGDTHSWEDTEVILPEPFAGRYRTIGVPIARIEANIPDVIRWNKRVKIERITG